MSVEIRGEAGVHKMLRSFMEPALSKELDAGTKRGAQLLAKALRAELRSVSKRMSRAVRVKRARRDRPAWVVGSRRKVAFFWPFVIGGTRDHGPRRAPVMKFQGPNGQVIAKRVRGVKPNPVVSRVAARLEDEAIAEITKAFPKE